MIDNFCHLSFAPAQSFGHNPDEVLRAIDHDLLDRLDFLVVQDIFLSETAQLADVVLPSASFAEKDGTFTNTDRRVQRVRKVFEPFGDSRADWQIVCNVAMRLNNKLGQTSTVHWDFCDPEEILAEMGRLVPAYAGITYDRLEGDGLQWPVPTDEHPGTPFLFEKEFPRGRAKFFPLVYQLSAEEPDAAFPFILTTGRVLYHWHGGVMTRRSAALLEVYPEVVVEINPEDAARMGLKQSAPVRVTSRRGTVVLRCKVTRKANPGVVFIPFHFAEAAANLLTIEALDPQAKIPEYKACAVRISPVEISDLPNPDATQARGRY